MFSRFTEECLYLAETKGLRVKGYKLVLGASLLAKNDNLGDWAGTQICKQKYFDIINYHFMAKC